MKTEQELLEDLVRDGSVDYDVWPELLKKLLARLDRIARHDFPPPPSFPILLSNDRPDSDEPADKENAPPQNEDSVMAEAEDDVESLPAQIVTSIAEINENLTKSFSTTPPHTIQRFAELLLHPRQHYRTLTNYLRAVERVISVSSGADIFPLPTLRMAGGEPHDLDGNPLPNGTSSSIFGLGNDDGLGGALLTPIPWLKDNALAQGEVHTESTEFIEGPLGTGSIETVTVSVNGVNSLQLLGSSSSISRSDGAVTQGELIRQEQEAGIVPISQLSAAEQAENEEHIHARGPEEVGVEDMGPQSGAVGNAPAAFDLEAALGRPVNNEEDKSEEQAAESEEVK